MSLLKQLLDLQVKPSLEQEVKLKEDEDGNEEPFEGWDLSQCINRYMDENGFHSFDGHRGKDRLEEIVGCLSDEYNDLDSFFTDNPGAIEAVIEWVESQNFDHWIENFKENLDPDFGKLKPEDLHPDPLDDN